jgi:hypothetical protein
VRARAQFQDSVYNEQKRRLAEQVTRSDGTLRPGTTKSALTPTGEKTETRIKLRPRKTG